ncbi:MAG: aminotransferase class I/II-fold pyridoxal phosphate-dependent enzyme, partial [Shewanellaceae bacterium]|nr:aminotransferase class I/II-fold pyridoxal phosphate-dependent enzyme [Shewanellaceae bacterium]
QQLTQNSHFFRQQMADAGFVLAGADHPIIPVMIGDEIKAADLAKRLQQDGIFVVAFSYPVVPKSQARIRTQISAAHTRTQLETAVRAFTQHGRELNIID